MKTARSFVNRIQGIIATILGVLVGKISVRMVRCRDYELYLVNGITHGIKPRREGRWYILGQIVERAVDTNRAPVNPRFEHPFWGVISRLPTLEEVRSCEGAISKPRMTIYTVEVKWNKSETIEPNQITATCRSFVPIGK